MVWTIFAWGLLLLSMSRLFLSGNDRQQLCPVELAWRWRGRITGSLNLDRHLNWNYLSLCDNEMSEVNACPQSSQSQYLTGLGFFYISFHLFYQTNNFFSGGFFVSEQERVVGWFFFFLWRQVTVFVFIKKLNKTMNWNLSLYSFLRFH